MRRPPLRVRTSYHDIMSNMSRGQTDGGNDSRTKTPQRKEGRDAGNSKKISLLSKVLAQGEDVNSQGDEEKRAVQHV